MTSKTGRDGEDRIRPSENPNPFSRLPSVDRLLTDAGLVPLIDAYGRELVTDCTRLELAAARQAAQSGVDLPGTAALLAKIVTRTAERARLRLRPVFNLTGTVLHTNLGRALLPASAVEAVRIAATRPCALEYDLGDGERGDRDSLVEPLLTRITGAEAATVVNNNAAAVLLALNTLAAHKEVLVSRGELVEIGGAFRIPDIMRRANARLVEVGTTNRTHAKDFETGVGPKTALLLKVHTSNYAIVGFTSSVSRVELASIAHARKLPVMEDLGSGTLVDLSRFGLTREPTPQDALQAGVDLVTFSGDKLLGGPQAGIIVGRRELIERIKKNPLKRALRADKMTLAALEAVLLLYLDPNRLPERLPTLRLLMRTESDIRAQAERLLHALRSAFAGIADVSVAPCVSQIGSGALPTERIPSSALVIRPSGKRAGRLLVSIERGLRQLPTPVIARIADASLLLDLRCLEVENEAEFSAQFAAFTLPAV
jgi:L-seryl-tRNA(Ser) seleniumtransferase